MTLSECRLSFVVPVFNALHFLPESIGSIRRAMAAAGSAELIVVDNGSTDGSWEWLERELAGAAVLARYPGHTVGALRNEGARRARGPLLAFIDADCVLPTDYVARAEAALAASGAAGTGSRYALPPAPHWVEQTWQELHDRPRDGPVSYINSGNLVVRAEAFRAVHGFDETLITGEDAELGQRMGRAGFPLHEAREVVAIHLGNPKSLAHFFRKQRWHSLGQFGTVDLQSIDRPTVMAFAQLLGLVAAGWGLLAPGLGWGVRAAVVLAGIFGPATIAVGFRLAQGGRTRRPAAAVLLYLLYLLARLVAVVDLAMASGKPSR